MPHRHRSATLGIVALSAALLSAPAQADGANPPQPLSLSASLVTDVVGVASGTTWRGARHLQLLQAVADADFGGTGLMPGTRARISILGTRGGRPNDLAETLQGIDNGEAADERLKLYEAWIERGFAADRAQLLVGLRDLNADFYQNDSAGLLMAPAFGIGSELAATGPNGPSVFPSTALTARLRLVPQAGFYVQAAVVNARAGTLGDPGGIDFAMRSGALLIAEAGATEGKLAVGYWRYTQRQPDVADEAARRQAQGVYLLADHVLRHRSEAAAGISLFSRVGLSDGDTTPYRGGWQAGVLVEGAIAGRPESRFSFGVNQAFLSGGYRRASLAQGERLSRTETGVEATYSDQLLRGLTIQPDLQFVRRPFSRASSRGVIVVGLRVTLSLPAD